MSSSSAVSETAVILGKRKQRAESDYVLRLESPSYDESTTTEFEEGSSTRNRATAFPRKKSNVKRFSCTYEGCAKAYSKPSRLAEHVRSHTGDVCDGPSFTRFEYANKKS